MSRSIANVGEQKLGDKLPEKLRTELYAVFRRRSDRNTDSFEKKWIGEVVTRTSGGLGRPHIYVIEGCEAAVSNALILIYLLGTGVKARNMITAVVGSNAGISKKYKKSRGDFIAEVQQAENFRGFEFAVLGVVLEKKAKIVEKLLSDDFDILRDHLPSPFEGSGLSLIARHFGKSVPWIEYRERYEQAQALFEDRDLCGCIKVLEQLLEDAAVRIPIAGDLLRNARLRLKEHEDLAAIIGRI